MTDRDLLRPSPSAASGKTRAQSLPTASLVCGTLEKKKGFVGHKKYACCIQDGKLSYQRVASKTDKRSSINLNDIQTVQRRGSTTTIEIVTAKKTHNFIAPSNDERDEWIRNLHEAMRINKTTSFIDPYSDEEDDPALNNNKISGGSNCSPTRNETKLTNTPGPNIDRNGHSIVPEETDIPTMLHQSTPLSFIPSKETTKQSENDSNVGTPKLGKKTEASDQGKIQSTPASLDPTVSAPGSTSSVSVPKPVVVQEVVRRRSLAHSRESTNKIASSVNETDICSPISQSPSRLEPEVLVSELNGHVENFQNWDETSERPLTPEHAPIEWPEEVAFHELKEFIRKNCDISETDWSHSSNCKNDFGYAVNDLKLLLEIS